MTYSPPWFKMIEAVYADLASRPHSPSDEKTQRVTDRAVSWLVAGKPLSPKLQKTLVDNINTRTKYQIQNPDQPIRLTKNQLRYFAKKRPEWFQLDDDLNDDFDIIEQFDQANENYITDLKAIIAECEKGVKNEDLDTLRDHFSHTFHTLFTPPSSSNRPMLDSRAPENALKEHERKEKNHEQEELRLASPHDQVQHSVSPGGMFMSGTTHELSHDTESPLTQDESFSSGHGSRRPDRGNNLTLWVKPDKRGTNRTSGYLEYLGERYALVFETYDEGLGKIPKGPWTDYVAQQLAPALLSKEAQAAAHAKWSTLSGLYPEQDSKGKGSPWVDNAMVTLQWSGGQPVKAILVNNQDQFEVTIEHKAGSRFGGQFEEGK